MYRTTPFISLGEQIDRLLASESKELTGLIRSGIAGNPWFTADGIKSALKAITTRMLDRSEIERWLTHYPYPENFTPRNIGVVMAGNIPLVGFFDLLCVLVSGHTCYVKPSSKDRALTDYLIRQLQTIAPEIPIAYLEETIALDAVIATGSNNSNRYFQSRYGHIPHLLRKSRTSIAVLTGRETNNQLKALSHDIFDYFGMGCRNVSKLFIPADMDLAPLVEMLKEYGITHTKYIHAYQHQRALLKMHGESFIDGGFFTLRKGYGLSDALPDLIYTPYESLDEIKEWIRFNDDTIQCIVTEVVHHPRAVGYGEAQQPGLCDYPDGVDVMEFLRSI